MFIVMEWENSRDTKKKPQPVNPVLHNSLVLTEPQNEDEICIL